MTDKQIIIDGVDVHWCEHYTGNIGYLTDKNWTCRAKIQGTKCEDWANCYFKRWQRKEQECDMWKNLTVDNGAVALKYQSQIDQLKAENKELKRCYKNNSALLDFEKTNTTKLVNKVIKLEKTLTEIKEIATKIIEDYDGNQATNMQEDAKEILQKISECEGNDE